MRTGRHRSCAAGLAATCALALAVPAASALQPEPKSLQGDVASWKSDPRMHEFYDLVVQACAQGCAKADVPGLEAKSRPVFARMAQAHGMSVPALQEHLAAIPRQMVQIGRDDPAALKTYEAFLVAVFGPD